MSETTQRDEQMMASPKDIRLTEQVKARVTEDQKEFVKGLAKQFGKSEAEIVRFALDIVNGTFPDNFFPSKEELEETRADVLKMIDVLNDFRRICKKAGNNENQIARAINSGKVDELGSNDIYIMIDETRELMDQCRDVYARVEPYLKYKFDRRPSWL